MIDGAEKCSLEELLVENVYKGPNGELDFDNDNAVSNGNNNTVARWSIDHAWDDGMYLHGWWDHDLDHNDNDDDDDDKINKINK